jgi:hypothetical protein
MHRTNDLDLALRDKVGRYYPPGIGPMAIRHAMLKTEINQ